MKGATILIFAAAMLLASNASADIAYGPSGKPQCVLTRRAPLAGTVPMREPAEDFVETPVWGERAFRIGRALEHDLAGRLAAGEDGSRRPRTPIAAQLAVDESLRSLPAGPDSASLFLLGMGGLGAWKLGRSACYLHLGATPAWFHTGAPRRIGLAVVMEPGAPTPVCIGVVCSDELEWIGPGQGRPPRVRRRRRCFLTESITRGPPAGLREGL